MIKIRRLITCVLLSAGLLAGCAGTSHNTQLYMLTPLRVEAGTQLAESEQPLRIGLGPVTMPPYLDRVQIVTRKSRTELVIADFDQWAEPLRDNFNRVLKENLATLIPTDSVIGYPWRHDIALDFQVRIEVIRFDRDEDGNCQLIARWGVQRPGADGVLAQRRVSYQQSPTGNSYAETVAAMNTALEHMSRDIAAEINRLASTK